jgi:hypothetical protein
LLRFVLISAGGANLQVLFDNNLLSMLELVLRSTLGG